MAEIKTMEINQGVEAFRKTPGAVLYDVRREEEYATGRIPGSMEMSCRH